MIKLSPYLTAFCLLIIPLVNQASEYCPFLTKKDTMIKQHLDKNGSFCVTLFFKQGELIKGTFDSLTKLDVYTDKKEHWRQLSGAGNSFMFSVPQDSNYWLVAKGDPNQLFNIDWQIIPQGKPIPYTLISPELIRLREQLLLNNSSEIFWQKIGKNGTPLIEPYDEHHVIMTFLWRGELQNIKIFGSPTGDHDELYNLENSDVWFRSYVVPKTTRYSYQLAPNIPITAQSLSEQRRAIIATAQQDPLNPNVYPIDGIDKFHRSSYIVLPDAPAQFGIKPESDSLKGTISKHQFNSKYLNNSRDITIYKSFEIENKLKSEVNLVILFDGKQYQQKTPIITIMDNLITHKKIGPTILVMIDTLDSNTRSKELPPNTTDMADCLAKELLPWLQQQGIWATPQKTVIAGSSFGGLASAYIAFKYPQYFQNVLSLSGSYWWGPLNHEGEWLSHQFAIQPTQAIHFYLNAGLFEGNLLISNRHFRDILDAKGYKYYYHETASGHDYLHWQGEFANGLQFLLNQ
ncbi:enterochelin esterase [Orbus wheelerorum]|uniref:enterochelin esterase n=1 Tax=Orbus wheelerorum TaxID=3074111 RepID=UPI00370D2DB7